MPSVLRSSRLRRIVLAYSVNRLGTWFGFVALALAVFDRTHSALAVAALLFASQVIPAFVVPAVVVRVEASSRRSQLAWLYLFEGLATSALAVLLWHFWLPAVLVLVALDGTAAFAASALLRTAAARAAHAHVEGHEGADDTDELAQEAEQKANAALNIAFSITFMLGPTLGGLVVAGAGASSALFIDATTFLICGAMVIDLHPHVEEGAGTSVRERLHAAWQHINGVPTLRALLLAQASALVFFECGTPIEVSYVKATLHAGDRGYGLLMGVWGLGVVVGSFIFARSPGRLLRILLGGGTLAVGLAYIGLALAPSLGLACGAALIGGAGNGVQWASLISAVQLLTPRNLHGRLMGAVESLGALCPAIGLSLGGVLVAISSPREAFLVVGAGATLTTLGFLRLSIRGGETTTEQAPAGSTAHMAMLEPSAHEPAGPA